MSAAETSPSRTRRWLWIGLGLFAVLLVSMVPAYFWARDWRAGNLSRQAAAMLGAQDEAILAEAWQKAQAAARLRPDDAVVIRTVAEVADIASPLNAPARWDDLLALPEANDEDRLAAARAYLRLREMGKYRERIAGLTDPQAVQATLWRLEGQAAAAEDNWSLARAQFDALLAASDDAEDALLAADILGASPRAEDRAVALAARWRIAAQTEPSPERLAQRRFLVTYPALTDEQRTELAAWLLEEPARHDKLRALVVQLQLDPNQQEAVYLQALEWFTTDSPAELVDLGRWLNRQAMHRYTVRLISQETAVQRQDLFLVYADAMAMVADWETLQQVLSRSDIPLEPYFEHLFRMRVRLEQGETRRAQVEWERALLEASDRPDTVLFLVRYTNRLGLSGFTREALEQLAQFPAEMRLALQTMLVLEERAQNTREVWRVLGRLATLDPDDHAVANDHAYYSLLLREDIHTARTQADQLVQRFPQLLAPKMTVILGHAVSEDWAIAADTIAAIPVNWSEVSARWRTLVATVWAQTGRKDAARALIQDVSWDQLLPEERALISAAMAG